MRSHFENNRATFSMIAAVACEIGEDSDNSKLVIEPDSSKTEALLDLAKTLDVDSITYREKDNECTLSMPVYERDSDTVHQQFAYRYNLSAPRQYDKDKHAYAQAKSMVNNGNKKQVAFDMKLARRWFFSFFYKDIG